MHFGMIPINVGDMARPERISALARKAEALGLESLWTFEHVLVPLQYESKYPYNASGKMNATPDTPFIDPLLALTFAAAHTQRIRLGTGVNILSQTNPMLLAKQAASLDQLSGGRLMLGLGVGWLREEFQVMGAPFERRGARADDYIAAMKKVWSGEVVEHESGFLRWHGFKSLPMPVQRPHPPLVIGGESPAALRRVARFGDGWFAVGRKPEQLTVDIAAIHRQAREFSRDPSRIEISLFWTRPHEGAEVIRGYEKMGISRLIAPWQMVDKTDPFAAAEKLAELKKQVG